MFAISCPFLLDASVNTFLTLKIFKFLNFGINFKVSYPRHIAHTPCVRKYGFFALIECRVDKKVGLLGGLLGRLVGVGGTYADTNSKNRKK